ncbi:MAG: hypothetical protein ACTHK3_07380 [Solirubrobacterales bacterium]
MSDAPPSSFPPPGAQPLWGSYKGGASFASPAPAAPQGPATPATPARTASASWLFGGEGLEPLSRRLLQVAGALSLLLVLVVANSFLNQGSASPFNPNPVAAAAERTADAPGAKFTMKATYTSSAMPQPMSAHGSGVYNSETEHIRISLGMYSPQEGRIRIEELGDGTAFYLRGTKISDQLPAGKQWLEIQPFLGKSEQEAMVGGGSATDSLKMLTTVGNVRLVGHEKVRGVPTRRYRSQIGMDDYAQLLSEEGKDELAEEYEKLAVLMPTPVVGETSIDRQGMVRRMREVMTMPSESGQPPVTMDIRMDLFAFGAHPDIQLPDSSEVFDATPFLKEQLDSVETE